ncbi:MAG: hypothetical protein WCK96_14145 [Methylococcales bacterium]
MLYVTLTLFGGILAYAVSCTNSLALLILPWVCLIMGWTYWVNDENTTEMAWIFG